MPSHDNYDNKCIYFNNVIKAILKFYDNKNNI